ncbi:hypothetical protein [Actinomadura livida]|uniref:Uncharacterized protein n=1 Tax=Actinomadura livida TaxID=79909 RepID=A0A7W7IJ47_9ACTN|nr:MULTISPECIES: hypothetical protein [Actinomadura]MBB4777974.1 hypothetical protein [Actinomadura catellatispora]GGT97489.1 hypothetical protein GCM10010208_21010 [Actinomadura livida]
MSDEAGTGARHEAKAYQQLGRLKATLREREARLAELEKRVAALEASTAVQFGRLVAGAARNPRRGRRLPRDLYRLWRKRNAPVSASGRGGGGAVQPDRVDRPENRLLVAGPCDRPIAAGVLAPRTASELAEHVEVVPLYPHDAAIVLDRADVDMVVVDASAGEPGGPWAYLGIPGMYDRDAALDEIRRIAAARTLPLVLLGGGPAPATLAALTWDAVLADAGRVAAVLELSR